MTPDKLQEIKNYIDTMRIIRRNVENNSEAFYEDKLLATLYYAYVELENNWNKIKELLKQNYYNGERFDAKDILDKMQKLERGDDRNEN